MECTVGINVVIPVYNCEAYVTEAIESVLNQPYKAIRIILVEDGSTDGSPAICDQYAKNHDRVCVIHQKNGGVSAARNAGIEFVLQDTNDCYKNGYIAFLDADDKWQSGFFDESVQSMLNGADLIGFQSCHCNGAGDRIDDAAPMVEGVYSGKQENVWEHSAQHFAAMLYRCDLLRHYQVRFFRELKYGEDTIFRMQCMYVADTIVLKKRVMYHYRHTSNSAVRSRKYGISYYVPIIDGWMRSDRMMEHWQNPDRGDLWEGRVMAAVCIIDMCKEHYHRFRKQRELDALFAEKPEYLELITGPFIRNRGESGVKWQAMKAHPYQFKLKCYLEGIIDSMMRMVYFVACKSKRITSMIDKRRYPYEVDKT